MHIPFVDYFAFWPSLIYVVAFFSIAIDSDATIFIIGFFTLQKHLNPLVVFLIVYAVVLVGDALWYSLGLAFKYLPLSVNNWVDRLATPFDDHLERRTFHTIFITKFTYGLHHVFLLRAGALHMPYRRILRIDALASIPWILIVGGLGYASGASFHLVRHYVKYAEVLLIILVVVFVFLERYITKYSRRKI